jgi:hypothetical protein
MPFALGCMRLSTDPARDEGRALATLTAALDAGEPDPIPWTVDDAR